MRHGPHQGPIPSAQMQNADTQQHPISKPRKRGIDV
jgi:hypothetical protein